MPSIAICHLTVRHPRFSIVGGMNCGHRGHCHTLHGPVHVGGLRQPVILLDERRIKLKQRSVKPSECNSC